jgi:hypothetical protein
VVCRAIAVRTVSISCCDIRGRAESHGWRSYPATAAPYRDYNASERLTFLRIDRLQMSNAGTETLVRGYVFSTLYSSKKVAADFGSPVTNHCP